MDVFRYGSVAYALSCEGREFEFKVLLPSGFEISWRCRVIFNDKHSEHWKHNLFIGGEVLMLSSDWDAAKPIR